MLLRFFGSLPLFDQAGDGGGGGAGPGVQTPAPNPPAPPVVPGNGGDAPVTRAEFNALMAKLDKLGQPPAPPPKPDAPKGGDDMTQLLRELSNKVDGLTAQQKSQQVAERKQQLVNAALAGVPDQTRGLAQLALDGLLASSGVNLDGDVNIAQLAEQLGGQLRTQFGATLFSVPGSQFKAVPKAANGGFDWSGVNSLSEVPPEMIKHIPDDVYRRFRDGGSSAVLPGGGVLPRSRFH